MTSVMIADFSGMAPLRDAILLPDNNAQFANNCWLYRGQVRGFRTSLLSATAQYADTQSVYRIPKDFSDIFDFSNAGSYWLEFPDPYMAVIRNPTVGDTWNRYYFFPSDKYNSTGANPSWPVTSPGPSYTTLNDIIAGNPPIPLGIPAPTVPPTVTPPLITWSAVVSAATAVGSAILHFTDTVNIRVGMLATDITDTRAFANTTITAAVGTTILTFSATTGIVVGMTVTGSNNPAAIFPGSVVSYVTPTTVTISFALSTSSPAGDLIIFDNVKQIPSGTTVKSVDSTTQITLTNKVVAAGVFNGDTIEFDTDVAETRAYIYTFVSTYGEESQPSPATVNTGDAAGTWIITIPAPPTGYVAPTIASYRLYRTVTDTSGNASYFQVAEVPINYSGTTTITDSALSASVTANKQLDSIGYSGPPAGLQGVVMMANGIAAGFTNEREIWFSAAYLPHAWPASFALTVDYPVVGLTANGTSLNIITEGSPFIATGVTPDTMTIGKITANEPCIGRGSIVSSGEGAYYASPNGIQLVNTGGTTPVTEGIYEKEFHYSLAPDRWAAGKYGQTYAGFIKGAQIAGQPGFPPYGGFVVDHTDANVPFSYLSFPVDVVNAYSDELSGQLFELMANRSIMQWNPPAGVPGTTTLKNWAWKSKQFRFTTPQQFKAFLVLFEVPPEVTITHGARNNDQSQAFNQASQYLIVRVYADGRQVVVREIQVSGEVLLIPHGFKAVLWEFMFEGVVGLKFFKVASSVHELKAT